MTRVLLALAVGALLFSHSAEAQLRAGQPAVLPSPPPAADPSIATFAQFRAVYAAAGAPRMVIFWNRAFDDEVASEYEHRQSEHEVESTTSNGRVQITRRPSRDVMRVEADNLRERDFEAVSGTSRVKPVPRAHVGNEATDWQLEEAFAGTMQDGGAAVVDRTMALRLAGLAMGAGERANVQELETAGMSEFADLIVEVLQSFDSRAPGGVSFRVLVRDLRNARTVASFVSAGRPPARRMPYVAGPSGFVRASAPEPGPSQIGEQLALETMQALTRSLP